VNGGYCTRFKHLENVARELVTPTDGGEALRHGRGTRLNAQISSVQLCVEFSSGVTFYQRSDAAQR
jgi:hypothetical protein